MANCRPYIPDFVNPECSVETGRVVAVAFINKAIHSTIYNNPSSAAVWVDGNYGSDLIVFTETRGTYSGGAPTEVGGLGKQSSRVINAEHTLNFKVEGVKNNELFWNALQKSHNFRVAFVVGGLYDLLMIQNEDVSIYATPPVEEGLDTELLWDVTVKWRDLDSPKTSDVPTGIFS